LDVEEWLTAARVTEEKAAIRARNLVPKSMMSSFGIRVEGLDEALLWVL